MGDGFNKRNRAIVKDFQLDQNNASLVHGPDQHLMNFSNVSGTVKPFQILNSFFLIIFFGKSHSNSFLLLMKHPDKTKHKNRNLKTAAVLIYLTC
jgi:hypothetical protein